MLRYNSDRYEVNAKKKRDAMSDEEEGSLKDFIDDEDDDEEEECDTASSDSDSSVSAGSGSVQSVDSSKPKSSGKANQIARRTRANARDCNAIVMLIII